MRAYHKFKMAVRAFHITHSLHNWERMLIWACLAQMEKQINLK